MEIVLTGYYQYFFGIYLIMHGLIHLSIVNYSEESGKPVGWNRKSWLFSGKLAPELISLLGRIAWLGVIILYILAGIGIFNLPGLKSLTTQFIGIASIIALIAFIVFIDGLKPTPYNWLIGIAIDIVLVLYLTILKDETQLVMIFLHVLALMGFIVVFISDVLPELRKANEKK